MEMQVTFRCSTADEVERLGAALKSVYGDKLEAGAAGKTEPKQEHKPEPAENGKTDESEATVEQLRAAGKALIDAGRRDDLKAVLDAHGCRNLAVVAESDRSAVLAELEKALS